MPRLSEQSGERGRCGRLELLVHLQERTGKMGARAFPQQKNSVEACKGLGPNSEAAGLQSFLVSENCLNIKSADKAKLDLCSNIDIWGLEKCRRKEGNKNGYTLRLVCSTGKDQVKYKGGQRSQKRFFFSYLSIFA